MNTAMKELAAKSFGEELAAFMSDESEKAAQKLIRQLSKGVDPKTAYLDFQDAMNHAFDDASSAMKSVYKQI
jgi:hypothetical protein